MARSHFSSQALVLIVISIAINMIGGQLASMVKLPIFLDSIGTLISAVLDVYKRQHPHLPYRR